MNNASWEEGAGIKRLIIEKTFRPERGRDDVLLLRVYTVGGVIIFDLKTNFLFSTFKRKLLSRRRAP